MIAGFGGFVVVAGLGHFLMSCWHFRKEMMKPKDDW
jgi:hypothetical protein